MGRRLGGVCLGGGTTKAVTWEASPETSKPATSPTGTKRFGDFPNRHGKGHLRKLGRWFQNSDCEVDDE